MVIFIFARTIGINGFLMVLGLLNHYLKLIFSPQTIAFNGFLMVFRFWTPNVNDCFENRHPKKYLIPFIFDEIGNAILGEA